MNFNHIWSSAKDYLFTLVLLFLIVLLSNSCEFEPHKIYERTVNEDVSAPEIQVVELNLDYDTIFLYGSKQIRFSFVSSDQEILAVRFTIDGNEEYLIKNNNGIFELDYRIYTNGIHDMVLEVYTASGSGSIAEHLGMEGFLFSKSWVLYIDQNYYFNVKSTISDGFLKLYWNRYRGYDFKEYVVYRTGWGTDKELARLKSGFFIDNTYVGEKARYDVEVITDNGTIIPWGFLELEKDLPKLHFIISESNKYIVKWNKSKYYNAVDSFRLSLATYKGFTNSTNKAINEPDDTTYIVPISYFGNRIDVTLRVVPKNSFQYMPGYYSLFESYLESVVVGFSFGTRNKGVTDISQVSPDEFMYITGSDSLVRYSVTQKQIVEKYGYQPIGCTMGCFTRFKVSPSGKYLTTYVDCDHEVMLANSGNLLNHTIRDLKSLSGFMYIPEIPVSDKGLVIINNSNGGFYLYNFNTDSTIAYYNKDIFTLQGLSISMNGDYILLLHDSLRLVHYINSEFINIWSHSRFNEPAFYEFDGKDSGRFVIWNGSILSVKQCLDFSTDYEFPLSDEKILDIDYYNNKILTWSAGHLYVRNFTDGSLLHDVTYTLYPGFWYNSCRLVGNAIICMQGVIYFLEEN